MPELACSDVCAGGCSYHFLPLVQVSADGLVHAAYSGSHRACAYEGCVAIGELREGEYPPACVVEHVPHPGDPVRGPSEHLLFFGRCGAALGWVRVEDGVMEQGLRQEVLPREVLAWLARGFGVGVWQMRRESWRLGAGLILTVGCARRLRG